MADETLRLSFTYRRYQYAAVKDRVGASDPPTKEALTVDKLMEGPDSAFCMYHMYTMYWLVYVFLSVYVCI